ncbi:YcbK family protein [Chelativorans sp. ZYF759]|uniref:YcbK family protein n=1 Tax=Chelativorans sp. ZYF759 TaxID=2692213 RepID=UPI0034D70165
MLLASCASTGDGDSLFGFNPTATGPASSTDFSRPTINSAASAAPVFDFDEDDPSLPDAMTDLPPTRERVAAQDVAAAGTDGAPADAQETAEAAPAAAEETQPDAQPQVAAAADERFADAVETPAAPAAPASQPEGRGFLSAFFSPQPSDAGERAAAASSRPTAQTQSRPQVVAAAPANPGAGASSRPAPMSGEALPGVRQGSLFGISQRSSVDDDGAANPPGSYRVASAAPGLARLAPNGLLTQTERVDVNCLQPALVRKLNQIENHFGRRVVVTSGYRSPPANRRARGASNSLHMYCAAADIQIEGVSKTQLADYVRNMPGRGGVGTYCHTESVHVDIGPERDWNWRCRRRN